MTKSTLKKFFILLVGVGILSLLAPSCSDEYDDSQIRKDILDLKDRIEKLEAQAKTFNSELATLNWLVKALQEKVYVAKVEQGADGYTIYFTDGTTAEIKNGEAGEDAPVIGIKADSDGIYYWTLTSNGTTQWLTDDKGQKLRAGSVMPQLGVDAQGFWTISYDGGKTSTRILDAEGNPVEALNRIFHEVSADGDCLNVTLADGTVISVPIRSNFYLLITDAPEVAEFQFGETRTFAIESVGVERTVLTKPDEWKVSLADNTLTVTAPTKEHETCADLEGEVSIIYSSASYLTTSVSMKVTVAEPKTIDIVITGKGLRDDGATISSTITPSDGEMLYYCGEYRTSSYDTDDPEEVLADQLAAINYFMETQGGWDAAAKVLFMQGSTEYTAKWLYENEDYRIIAFGVRKETADGKEVAVATTPLFVSEVVRTLMDESDVVDLSAGGTANSYIVNQPNTKYKFKATVMGNGASTKGIVPAAIDPKLAFLVWETGSVKNAVIKDVELTSDGYVRFSTGDVLDGNALIAVTDNVPIEGDTPLSLGTILWSWHIWATDYTPEMDKKCVNADAKEFMLMDRNLGEWSDKNTLYSGGYWGLKYQWGRKDPFVSFTYSGVPAGACVSHHEDYVVDADYAPTFDTDEESLALAIQYPHIFIKGGYATNNDWYGASTGAEHRNNDLWGNGDGATSVKTIYDPCPVGYKVAPFEAFSGFYTNESGGLTIYPENLHVSGSFAQGWNFITEGENYTFFPAAGSITGSTASARSFGTTGYYFSSTPVLGSSSSTATQVKGMRVESSCIMLPSMNRSDGASVRCVRE